MVQTNGPMIEVRTMIFTIVRLGGMSRNPTVWPNICKHGKYKFPILASRSGLVDMKAHVQAVLTAHVQALLTARSATTRGIEAHASSEPVGSLH